MEAFRGNSRREVEISKQETLVSRPRRDVTHLHSVSTTARYHSELKWEEVSANVDASTPVAFRIFIKQQNKDLLAKTARSVSDPDSSSYGQYLSVDQVTEIIAPSAESLEIVDQWINSFNPISVDYHKNKDSVRVVMSASNVESMLSVQLSAWVHSTTLNTIVRSAKDPVLEDNISAHIDLITGISHFPVIKNRSINKVPQIEATSGDITILSIKGAGEILRLTFVPACSPSCGGKYLPVSINVAGVNQAFNTSVSTESIVPTCTVASDNSVTCVAVAHALLYTPSIVTISDVAGNTVTWPYNFVSTPVVIPETIKTLYGIPDNYVITNMSATQCVVEFEQQYYSPSDLIAFFERMGLPTTTPVTVIGYNDQTNPGIEASLDIQYMMGISTGSPTTFWSIYTNSSAEVDNILEWELAMTQAVNPPLVNSLSYGMTESNVDTYLGTGYLARSDVEFQKLALLGVSVIIADGDAGASDLGGAPMGTSDCNALYADWPSQSPYVTAVSSTFFTPNAEPICYISPLNGGVDCSLNAPGEISVSVDHGMMWTTGGGISNTSSRPWYQDTFVTEYFDELANLDLVPPASLYSAGGRSYPDVATVGHNLFIVNDNEWMTVDGTSASAPIFGGMVTILNDVRMNAGKSPLGFMNPLLYKIAVDHPEAFYDVTVGNNRCGVTNFSPTCCPYGWSAVQTLEQEILTQPLMNINKMTRIIEVYWI
eukprot:gene1425-1653_t